MAIRNTNMGTGRRNSQPFLKTFAGNLAAWLKKAHTSRIELRLNDLASPRIPRLD